MRRQLVNANGHFQPPLLHAGHLAVESYWKESSSVIESQQSFSQSVLRDVSTHPCINNSLNCSDNYLGQLCINPSSKPHG